jgi:lipopolysaccharide exporter
MQTTSQTSADNRKYWIRSSLLTLLEKGFGLLFGLGLAMILWRSMTKAEVGTWGVFLLVTALVEMTRSGMIQNALMRFIAQNADKDTELGHIQTSALVLSVMFSIVSTFLLFVSLGFMASKLDAPQLVEIFPIYFLINFVMIAFYHANYVQQANLEFRGIFWSTFYYRGLPFAWAVYCIATGSTLYLKHLAIAMLVGATIGALVSAKFAFPYFRIAKQISKAWLGKMLSYGKYVLGTNLSTMIYKNIDRVAVGSVIGTEAFAIYDAAAKITQMVEVPSFSMAAVVFPQSSRAMHEQGTEGVKQLYERSVAAILAFILPFIVACLLFAEPIVRILAGPEYIDSAGILRLTALFALFLPFAVQFGTILDSTGKPHTNFWYTTFTAVLNLGLSFVFVRKFGLYGGAYATLLSYIVSFVLMQRVLGKEYRIRPLNAIAHVPVMYKAAWQMVSVKLNRATV